MSASANYKVYFNAFDDHVQQPKLPDNMTVSSAGLKVRETFVLKCNQLLKANSTPNAPYDENKNVLIYFHPGLAQNFYVMAYKFDPSTPTVIGEIKNEYDVYWRILKVGNNGVPFNIFHDYHRSLDVGGQSVTGVLCKDVSGLKIKAARVVSSAMRIFNVGLQVADVIEIKQDYRLPSDEFAKILNAKKGVESGQTIGPVYTDPLIVDAATTFEQLHGYMLALFPFRLRPIDNNSYNSSTIMYDYTFNPVTNIGTYNRRMNYRLLNNSVGWEDAPFHTVIPSGSMRGLQINALPITDHRPFREWHDFMCTQNAGDLDLTNLSRYDGFSECDNHVVTNPLTQALYNRHCRYYPTVESEKITEFFADPDFMGTWIRIIQPNSDLEILFECITNYELLCYPDSPYYTFTSYNDKIPISISDVRSLVETTYGNLYSWEIQVANDVSKTIDDYIGNYASYGSTTTGTVLQSNQLSVRPNQSDNGFLNSAMYNRQSGNGNDNGNGGGGGKRRRLAEVDESVPEEREREKMVLPESYATFFEDIYKRNEGGDEGEEEVDDADMNDPVVYTPRRYDGDVSGSYAPLIPPSNFQISGNAGYRVNNPNLSGVDGRPPRLQHKKKKHKTKFSYYR